MSLSYDFAREYRGPESELQRLQSQLDLSWEREARLLGWLGLRDGMRLLELGCGPGFVTERLVQMLPASRVVAVDVESTLLKQAPAQVPAAARDRVTWIQTSAAELGMRGECFDFAIARYVFQHLARPVQAAREVWRVLRPGGQFAIIDIDALLWGIAEPLFPELSTIYAKARHGVAGGNRLIGRRLWRILKAAGFEPVQLEAFVYHSDAQGIRPFLTQLDPGRLTRAYSAGLITSAEWSRAHELYQQFLAARQPYILMVGLLAWGVRPERG
jgi:ubiquinone/menaquinone biosynthesis C-methylase UbiE